jgi:hypothetical protein
LTDVTIVTVSLNLIKALGLENSQQPVWNAGIVPLTQAPANQSTYPAGTPPSAWVFPGVFNAGAGGNFTQTRIRMLPYCNGPPGSQFSFRLYGWRDVVYPEGNPNALVWVPEFDAEFACTSCAAPGPTDPNVRMILPTENFCDTITLTQGNLGPTGFINSTGPGTNLIAYAVAELGGCRKFQFDFQQTDPVGMNLLFVFA